MQYSFFHLEICPFYKMGLSFFFSEPNQTVSSDRMRAVGQSIAPKICCFFEKWAINFFTLNALHKLSNEQQIPGLRLVRQSGRSAPLRREKRNGLNWITAGDFEHHGYIEMNVRRMLLTLLSFTIYPWSPPTGWPEWTWKLPHRKALLWGGWFSDSHIS